MERNIKFQELVARTVSSVATTRSIREAPAYYRGDRTPLWELILVLLRDAIKAKASDIHIEPLEEIARIRFRIDGLLRIYSDNIPMDLYGNLVSRLKLAAQLNIAEGRMPQNGSFALYEEQQEIDIRLAVLPTVYGEKLTIRILNNMSCFKLLEDLDMSSNTKAKVENLIFSGPGAVLIAGPVNSGKTTTLYAILHRLEKSGRNIISIEDTVEYRLRGISQIQLKEEIGFTYERALEAVLRQDIDILAVGELRSRESAGIFIKSALTGHEVYGTIHTDNGIKTIFRLRNMGIEAYLLASAVKGVITQRLLPRLCPYCKKRIDGRTFLNEEEVIKFKGEFFGPVGCPQCENTGYRGRIALHEVFAINSVIREGIYQGVNAERLKSLAEKEGLKNLREDGLMKAAQGEVYLKDLPIGEINKGGDFIWG